MTTPPVTPSTPSKKANRRRSWFGLVTPTRRDKGDRSVSAGPTIPSRPTEDSIEELDITPKRRSVEYLRRGWNDDDMMFDVDSDWEGTGTMRVRRQREEQNESPGRRQRDLATLAILSRNNTVKPKPTSRIFSRTVNESERLSTSPGSNPSNLPPLAAAITPSHLPRRTSSIVRRPMNGQGSPTLTIDTKPVNKPLPQIPSSHEQAASHPGPPLSPIPPTDIVVTPSSPLDTDPFDLSFDLPYPRAGASSAPPSAPRAAVSEAPSPFGPSPAPSIGHGLPEKHPRRQGAKLSPAGVSVSSPLPRGASPSPKVAFATEPGSHDYKEDKVKAPRPRSFSAMFTRSPLLNSDQTDDDEPGPSRFNWLGVRKTIKRRRSESKLRKQGNSGGDDTVLSSAVNRSTPVLVDTRPDSSATNAAARSGAPEVSTPSSLASFVLPPVQTVDQEEWFAARRSGEEKEELNPESDSKDSGSIRRARGSSFLSNPALASLPEVGPAPPVTQIQEEAKPVEELPRRNHNRRRSYSDAGRRSFIPTVTDGPHSLSSSPRSAGMATLVEPPKSPMFGRPGSSTLGKMRSVFTISGRARSNSALRYATDEREDGRDTPFTRPASSASAASSYNPSPALPPVRIRPEEVPQVSQLLLQTSGEDDRRVVLTDTPDRSPRSSISASLSSRTLSQGPTRRSATVDPYAQGMPPRANRARASTIASGAVSWNGTFGFTSHSNHSTTGTFGHAAIGHDASGSTSHLPLPTPTFPTSATPSRRPSSIRRLSTGLFRGGAISPKISSGVIPRSGSLGQVGDDFTPGSRSGSAMGMAQGAASFKSVEKGLDKKDVDTTIHPSDTSQSWMERVSVISRRQLAGILAESADKFHSDALNLWMTRFDFQHTALDVAVRRLLMDLALPKETQQIDRVIEAFAQRYDACEPTLFGSKDNTYVLAFSMIMLHTDAFNRHNKNKMTKADYVRNTRLDGVPETVLEAFYDNITFTPFVFLEDDNESSSAFGGSSGPVRAGRVDVYDMIASNTIMTLRANVEGLIPPDSPFSCMGTMSFLDCDRLQRKFADAHPLQYVKSRPRRKSSVTMPALPGSLGAADGKSTPKEELQTLKVTKVGLITRKDDSLVNGKRQTGRKWKNWSVILTGSQLLFFKDTILALTLLEQIRNSTRDSVPRMTGLQPDEVLSVKECVAVWDRGYVEVPFAFRFIMPEGRQFIMQTLDESEMNDWLTLINYAGTFKSAGIRMRAPAIDSGEAVLAGTAAAESHRRELASGGTRTTNSSESQTRTVLFSDTATTDSAPARPKLRRVGSLRSTPTPVVDITGANDVVVGGGEQIEAVIGSVKAELAAGRGASARPPVTRSQSVGVPPLHKSQRTETIQRRVQLLRDSAAVIEKRLAANLRLGRNLALLTPFQKLTRDRIEAAVPDVAQQIRNDRIELAKLHLWITMLLKDQERDEREWARVRHVALQAAAKSLRNGLSVMDRRATLAHPIAIPKLSLPDDGWTGTLTPGMASQPVSPGLMSPGGGLSPVSLNDTSPASGISDLPSRMSGIEDEFSDHPAPNSARNSSASGSSDYELASEYLSASSVLSFHDEPERQLDPVRRFDDDETEHLDDEPAEQAEHWRNTRAGTKVSLASLPRDGLGELSERLQGHTGKWI